MVDPEWLKRPSGITGELWRSNLQQDIEQLIAMGITISNYSEGVSVESRPAILDKVRQLLRLKISEQHEELMAEFHIGASLAATWPKVEVDPLVRPLGAKDARGRTPDYSVSVGGVNVFFESTVLRSALLTEWRANAEHMAERIFGQLAKRGVNRDLTVRTTLNWRRDMFSRQACSAIVSHISAGEEGDRTLEYEGEQLRVSWRSMLAHVATSEAEINRMALEAAARGDRFFAGAISESAGTSINSSHGISRIEAWSFSIIDDIRLPEVIHRSLDSTMSAKRSQFCGRGPAILAIKPAVMGVDPAHLIEVIRRRFWPSKTYSSLGGVLIYVPSKDFSRDDGARAFATWNPNAVAPAPKEVMSVLPEFQT
jgi:hypothetical protein